jgi:hypothetical protein
METTLKNPANLTQTGRRRTIAYWAFTLPVVFENAAGAMWLFSRFIPGIRGLHATSVFAQYVHVMLAHLGYPQYFQYILNPWQLACAAALIAPRLPRVKEWAYAGAFFNYSSAIASHLFAGDGLDVPAAVLAALTVISWALRPADRRLAESPPAKTSPWSWVASAIVLVLMLILSLFWLPKIPQQ